MKKEQLKIEHLKIGYGKGKNLNVIHDQMNASLIGGELACLLGENGAGKSTLIRSLCGFQPVLGGKASINGKDVVSLTERQLALNVSVVLTDRVVVPNATVQELVGLGRSPYTGLMGRLNQEDKTKVADAMEQCGIAHKKDKPITNLSDGEKQKAFIAKALAQDTPIMILDEPTAFLDMPARVEVMQLLRQIANSGEKSILMSTHDLDLALQMADRLWLLGKEKPLLTGSPEDLLLSNQFQMLFKNRGVEFDTRTGLFKVGYHYQHELAVKGDGFEYVLLRRAFARKGIRAKMLDEHQTSWVEISDSSESRFKFFKQGECLYAGNSIEEVVHQALILLN
jgi:iron complex transport system ATP-binding protein